MEIAESRPRRYRAEIQEYILECINSEDHGIVMRTTKEKLEFLRDRFISEYSHNVKHYGGWQNTFVNWMQGLPSVFNVDFENYHILELMKRWHRDNKTKATESKIIEMYWRVLYMEVNALLRKNGLKPLDE
jgi:hypothetical protein